MRLIITLMAACAIATAGSTARAQDQTNTDKFVSKDDYLKLKEDHAKLKQELDALKNQMQEVLKKTAVPESEALKTQLQDLQKKAAAQQAETDQSLDDLDKQVKAAKQMAKDSFPGTTKMLLAGYGSATFTSTTTGYGPSQPPGETPAADDRPSAGRLLPSSFSWWKTAAMTSSFFPPAGFSRVAPPVATGWNPVAVGA